MIEKCGVSKCERDAVGRLVWPNAKPTLVCNLHDPGGTKALALGKATYERIETGEITRDDMERELMVYRARHTEDGWAAPLREWMDREKVEKATDLSQERRRAFLEFMKTV